MFAFCVKESSDWAPPPHHISTTLDVVSGGIPQPLNLCRIMGGGGRVLISPPILFPTFGHFGVRGGGWGRREGVRGCQTLVDWSAPVLSTDKYIFRAFFAFFTVAGEHISRHGILRIFYVPLDGRIQDDAVSLQCNTYGLFSAAFSTDHLHERQVFPIFKTRLCFVIFLGYVL